MREGGGMANPEHVAKLQEGVETWNARLAPVWWAQSVRLLAR
jgi:hypothetical protein